jgi:hypothetical protein
MTDQEWMDQLTEKDIQINALISFIHDKYNYIVTNRDLDPYINNKEASA